MGFLIHRNKELASSVSQWREGHFRLTMFSCPLALYLIFTLYYDLLIMKKVLNQNWPLKRVLEVCPGVYGDLKGEGTV